MGELDGRVAVVTGGGRGIGRAAALALADAGAAVAVLGRNTDRLAETCAAIREGGGHALALACDVGDLAAVPPVFQVVRAELGPVDILVNNAGISASMKFAETPDEVWEQILRVNVGGAFACCKAVVPEMIARRWGRIINIASIAGLQGMPYGAAYSASKHALIGLTRSLAGELERYGITSNAVCPGWTDTDMMTDFVEGLVARTGREAAKAQAALLASGGQRQLVTPAEVAATVLRLASPDSQANGETVVIV